MPLTACKINNEIKIVLKKIKSRTQKAATNSPEYRDVNCKAKSLNTFPKCSSLYEVKKMRIFASLM